tara:strand:+ start:568 stop:1323 length:756 start_codon:yes stop_codon:yes gene_type:complete
MDKEKVKQILLGRLNKLTDFEKEWMYENNHGWYNRYLFDYHDNRSEGYTDSMWENLWLYSAFGQCYLHCQALAKKFLSSEKKMNHVMDMMEDRKTWYTTKTHIIKNLYATGKLTQNIMAFMIPMMRKHNLNIFESYVNDPLFDTGSIAQFRSNVGTDAVVVENRWGSQKQHLQYYGSSKADLRELKGKTFMVLGENPPLGGKCYANAYTYKDRQGGSRLYRVLPIGDTKVYIVVEKFLKKCRTKAVKDARK